jgi:hypothetical protein
LKQTAKAIAIRARLLDAREYVKLKPNSEPIIAITKAKQDKAIMAFKILDIAYFLSLFTISQPLNTKPTSDYEMGSIYSDHGKLQFGVIAYQNFIFNIKTQIVQYLPLFTIIIIKKIMQLATNSPQTE